MSSRKRALQPSNSLPVLSKSRRLAQLSSHRENEENCEGFSFETLCIVCGSERDKQKGRKLCVLQEQGRDQLVRSAKGLEGTEELLSRIRVLKDTQDTSKFGKYHRLCYKDFTVSKKIKNVTCRPKDVQLSPLPSCDTLALREDEDLSLSPYLSIASELLSELEQSLQDKKIYLLGEVADMFQQKFVQKFPVNKHHQVELRRSRVKQWILRVGEDKIAFHSLGVGRPDIMCKIDLALCDILQFCMSRAEEMRTDNFDFLRETTNNGSDNVHESTCLKKSAAILQHKIDEMPSTIKYPTPEQCSLEFSVNHFIPTDVLNFFKDLIATPSAAGEVKPTETQMRMAVTAAEVVIFGRRRTPKAQVIGPADLGLAASISYENGSKTFLKELHSFGYLASYDELRRLLAAVGSEELGDNTYVPSNLIPIVEGGLLLQEYDDNVDIDTETVDGHNTAHFMGRVIFQVQSKDQIVVPSPSLDRQQRRSLDLKKQDMPQFQVMDFQKLTQKPEPEQFVGAFETIVQFQGLVTFPHAKDILWVILRGYSRGIFSGGSDHILTQKIPFWTAFNTRTVESDRRVTKVAYLPSIDHRPSDMRTVYTTMMRGQETAKALGQSFHVHTMDMQLYIVAQQVKMSVPEVFPSSCTVLRLGGFHTACIFIQCIGKLWGDAGLRDILVDTHLYAGVTADQMLKGRQFHRAVRGLTISFEILMNLFLENFQAWLIVNDSSALNNLLEFVRETNMAYSQLQSYSDMNAAEEKVAEMVIPLLKAFETEGRAHIPTFSFWSDCLYALEILLMFIRAERESDWHGHLAAISAMLPFFFVCDRTNYARWTPLYVLEMASKLPDEVRRAFQDKQHSVKLSEGAFKGLFTDIAGEMTVVRDMKSVDSGIVGYTNEEKGLLLWVLTRHVMAAYRHAIRERSGRTVSGWLDEHEHPQPHKQESPGNFKRYEEDVQKALDFFRASMVDPFSASGLTDRLIHIGNAGHALPAIQASLVNAIAKGQAQLQTFVKARLETDPHSRQTKFHQALPHSGLKTFTDMLKPTAVRANGILLSKAVSADIVHRRALEVQKHRGDEFDMSTFRRLPMTGVPTALFKPDGTLRKTDKSVLMKLLESLVKPNSPVTDPDPLMQDMVQLNKPSMCSRHTLIRVVDMMADLQKLNPDKMKLVLFGDVGDYYVKFCTKELKECDQLHLVFDRYDDEVSPKEIERRQRYMAHAPTYEIEAGRRVLGENTFIEY